LYVVAKLEIPDHLGCGPKTAKELASLTGVDADALYRVLRLVAGQGVLAENGSRRFALTKLGNTLCGDTENSVRDYLLLYHELAFGLYVDLLEGVKNGESVTEDVLGGPLFDYLERNPEARRTYVDGLSSQARLDNISILENYDFTRSTIVADIGGGNGVFLFAILQRYENLTGILFDLEATSNMVRQSMGEAQPRCIFKAGDFFEEITTGADTYILKLVLHDWTDDRALKILQNCRRAMPDHGKLLIIERLIGSASESVLTHNVDLTMLLMSNGLERSEQEFVSLLDQSDFRLDRVIPTGLKMNILEASPKVSG
jgi:hypothetical protein